MVRHLAPCAPRVQPVSVAGRKEGRRDVPIMTLVVKQHAAEGTAEAQKWNFAERTCALKRTGPNRPVAHTGEKDLLYLYLS